MGVIGLKQQGDLKEWNDLWFNEYKRAGYVSITDLNKQFFYGSNDVQSLIAATKGKEKRFISLNAFDGWADGRPPTRQTTDLKQIRNIAVDIDQYNLGLSADDVLDELQVMILSRKIPEPNLVLVSRGVQIFYAIDKGASPAVSWLSEYITTQFINKLKHLGADSNADGVTRVMRVPNSVNERNKAIVKPSIWNDQSYSLQELLRYCKPPDQSRTRKKTRFEILHFPLHSGLERHYQTNYARTEDLKKLIELRKGNFTNMRNTLLYIYSFHEALKHNTQKDLISYMGEVFEGVYGTDDKKGKFTESEFERTVRKAKKDADNFFKYYQENGYRVIYKSRDGIRKPYKTENLIKKLYITEEEQAFMRSIRNEEIKRKQRAKYMREKRLADGTHKQTREQYEASRQKQQLERVDRLAKLVEDNPNATQRELAAIMGVSLGTINRLLKIVNR